MTEKIKKDLMSKDMSEWPDDIRRNYFRNKKLIDLSEIPSEIQEKIKEKYENATTSDRRKLLGYFAANRLRNLMDKMDEF